MERKVGCVGRELRRVWNWLMLLIDARRTPCVTVNFNSDGITWGTADHTVDSHSINSLRIATLVGHERDAMEI